MAEEGLLIEHLQLVERGQRLRLVRLVFDRLVLSVARRGVTPPPPAAAAAAAGSRRRFHDIVADDIVLTDRSRGVAFIVVVEK